MPPRRPNQPPEKRLLTRAELAREKHVSRAAVTHACKSLIASAVVGNRVDASHPAVQEWLAESPRGAEASTTSQGAEPHLQKMQALNRRKREAEARKLELQNAMTEGKLISRELVLRVVGAVDGAFKRLLTDAVASITLRLPSMVRGTASLEELRTETREIISRALAHAKHNLQRAIAAPPPPEKPKRRKKRAQRK